jgi:hypothetical protein
VVPRWDVSWVTGGRKIGNVVGCVGGDGFGRIEGIVILREDVSEDGSIVGVEVVIIEPVVGVVINVVDFQCVYVVRIVVVIEQTIRTPFNQ